MKRSLVDRVYSKIRGVCSAGEDVLLLKGLAVGCVEDGEGKVDGSLEEAVPDGTEPREVLARVRGARCREAIVEALRRNTKVIVCAKEKRYKYMDVPLGIGLVESECERLEGLSEAGDGEGTVFRIRLFETFPAREILEALKAQPGARNGHFLRREFYKNAALEPRKEMGSVVVCKVGVYSEPL
jgi:hypothetical protein